MQPNPENEDPNKRGVMNDIGYGWCWRVPDLIEENEEEDLVEKSERGDLKARASLVLANLRLVLFLASSISRFPSEKEDLIGEGLMGAWVAANCYDSSRGVKFCTFATWWIRSFMLQYMRTSRRFLVRAPNTSLLRKELARAYVTTGLGSEDEWTMANIADRLGMSPDRLQVVLDASKVKRICLGHSFPGRDDSFEDTLASDAATPEEEFASKELEFAVKTGADIALAALSDKEAAVVQTALMGDGSFSDAGAKLGVTKQRAKQICDKAVSKMRRHLMHSNFHARIDLE